MHAVLAFVATQRLTAGRTNRCADASIRYAIDRQVVFDALSGSERLTTNEIFVCVSRMVSVCVRASRLNPYSGEPVFLSFFCIWTTELCDLSHVNAFLFYFEHESPDERKQELYLMEGFMPFGWWNESNPKNTMKKHWKVICLSLRWHSLRTHHTRHTRHTRHYY